MPFSLSFFDNKWGNFWIAHYAGVSFLICSILCLVLFYAPPLRAETLSLEELLSHIQKQYENTSALKALFVQVVHIKSIDKKEREEGIVYVKNPGRMLWHYTKPKVKKVYITPTALWLYLPEDRVAYVQHREGGSNLKQVLKILSDVKKVKEDFHIRFSSPHAMDTAGNYLLTLVPKASNTGIEKLFLTVDKDSYNVSECSFSDQLGNVTNLQFRDVKVNIALPQKLFDFKPPKGTELFHMP